jgi:hypothetical protein
MPFRLQEISLTWQRNRNGKAKVYHDCERGAMSHHICRGKKAQGVKVVASFTWRSEPAEPLKARNLSSATASYLHFRLRFYRQPNF